MKKRRPEDLVTHLNTVTANIARAGHNQAYIDQCVNRIRTNYESIDNAIKSKGWKFLVKHFLSKEEQNPSFYNITHDVTGMCVKLADGTYNVSFSFRNPKDPYDNDRRKYVVYNYFKQRYFLSGVVASSALNAIVVAFNQSYKLFPKLYRYKLIANLVISHVINNNTLGIMNWADYVIPDFLKKPIQMYKQLRQEFMEKFHCEPSDFRFYYFGKITIVVLRKDNTFTVSFTFRHEKDNEYIDRAVPSNWIKHIERYCALKNMMENKYTYTCDDVPNSMTAACRIFNLKRSEFPEQFRDAKMFVDIAVIDRN